MSLKHFHLVFILSSTLIVLWYGFWELRMIGSGSTAGHIALAVMSAFIAGGLIFYTIQIVQKFRRISA